MSPVAIIEQYTERAARAWDKHCIDKALWRGMGAAHALHAVGLLSDAEQGNTLSRLVDVCAMRTTELAAESGQGGAQ